MTVNIYQIKNSEECDYIFMSYKFALSRGFSIDNYEKVYSYSTNTATDLEDIYYIFNMKRPADFKGHSLSVSDIIELNGIKYYCDIFGFQEVT